MNSPVFCAGHLKFRQITDNIAPHHTLEFFARKIRVRGAAGRQTLTYYPLSLIAVDFPLVND